MIKVHVDFEGGLENDFNAPKGLDVDVNDGTTLAQLPKILSDKYLGQDKSKKFISESGNVLNGILVMINDCDAEIEGIDSKLSPNDTITYITTLHGG